MTSRVKPAHAAPLRPRYIPEPVTFARHRVRRPNRRPLAWHLDNLAAVAVVRLGERAMRAQRARS